MLSLFSCKKDKPKDNTADTSTETTEADTTEPETTSPDTTVSDTEGETTTFPETTEPYQPIYEDGGFTYKVDIRGYLPYICPENAEDFLIIANRKHPLGSSYVPKNLVSIDGGSYKLVSTAVRAFEAMRLEMQKSGVYDTRHQSTYRSYSYQKNLYQKYIDRERAKYPHLSTSELMAIVDTYSARAGTSDHQTGLTIDFNPINSNFSGTKAFKYLKENAHKFGFILRYPKGKENITGYKYEPWHWRFVGRDAAAYIYEHGITLEEYMAEINGTAVETFPPMTTPSLTPPATTAPPTTEPPVTEPPATDPPTTEPPVTDPIETEPETTSPSETEPEPADTSSEASEKETTPEPSDSTTGEETLPELTEPDGSSGTATEETTAEETTNEASGNETLPDTSADEEYPEK